MQLNATDNILDLMIADQKRSTVGDVPKGFEWIDDEPNAIATVGDTEACETAKATLVVKQNQLKQLQATKGQLQEAAIDAAMAENQEASDAIQAQLVAVNGSLWNAQADVAALNALIAECETLTPPVEPPPYVEPPPPPYVPPPAPAPTAKKSDRSWLLLAVAAVGIAAVAVAN